MSLTGIEVGQAVVAVLAVLVISSEYSTGMIRVTLTAMPRRWTVLAAKAAALTGLVLAAAVVAVVGSLAAGRLLLARNGVTAASGIAAVHGPVLRAAAGSVLYLALVGLLTLGIATIVRDSAAATGAVLGILYVPPVIALFLGSEPAWQHWVERYTPTNAGLAILNTTGLSRPDHQPVGRPRRAGRVGRGRAADRGRAPARPRRLMSVPALPARPARQA